MGVAILCLVIGIPLGLVMLCKPKQIWWATQSWKFKNPEANEPSEAGYGMSALGGLGVIVAAIILASLAWSTASDKKAADEKQRQQDEWDAAVAAYVPPKPENRGALPIIGYVETPREGARNAEYKVYYLRPPGAVWADMKQMPNSKGRYQCVTHVGSSLGHESDTPRVHASLSWEPDVPQRDGAASDACTVGNLATSSEIDSDTTYEPPGVGLITDSSIVDPHGAVLKPAAPDNAVPELSVAPRR